MAWQNTAGLPSAQYTCGYCSHLVASVLGFATKENSNRVRICPNCDRPTYFEDGKAVPGVPFGNAVAHLPTDVAALYSEARSCAANSAYTASVLLCRKLLMNIAVSLGAAPGATFISYVEHLSASGYVPPNGKGWVDHIRKKGNEATHEIALMQPEDAKDLILFSEMLLKFIFEFPKKIPTP